MWPFKKKIDPELAKINLWKWEIKKEHIAHIEIQVDSKSNTISFSETYDPDKTAYAMVYMNFINWINNPNSPRVYSIVATNNDSEPTVTYFIKDSVKLISCYRSKKTSYRKIYSLGHKGPWISETEKLDFDRFGFSRSNSFYGL